MTGTLPQDATLNLYWSGSEKLGSQKELASKSGYKTGRTAGRRPITIPKFNLTAQPDFATHLVAVIDYVEGDSDGLITESSELNNETSTAVVTDLTWLGSGISWAADGITGSYEVKYQNASVTNIAFYWSSDQKLSGDDTPATKAPVALNPAKGKHDDLVIGSTNFVPPPKERSICSPSWTRPAGSRKTTNGTRTTSSI